MRPPARGRQLWCHAAAAAATGLAIVAVAEGDVVFLGAVAAAEAVARRELQELRSAPPAFLARLGSLTPLCQVVVGGALITGESSDSVQWWAIDLTLRAPHGSAYGQQGEEYAVRVTLNSSWPDLPPAGLRLLGSVPHVYVDEEDSGEVRLPLSYLFISGETGAAQPFSLRSGLTRLHFALGWPLTQRTPQLEVAWREAVRMHEERLSFSMPGLRPRASALAGDWREEWLDPQLAAALRDSGGAPAAAAGSFEERCSRGMALSQLAEEVMPGVFEVPAFAPALRRLLREELEAFVARGPAVRRPNNHHRHGAIASDMGLEPFLLQLLRQAFAPLARALFPLEGAEIDDQHSFFVRYGPGQDTWLDSHHDDSDVTINVALDDDGAPGAEGADLFFCGLLGAPDHRQWRASYRHRPGHAVVHLGHQRHGVGPLRSGSRQSLIVWGRSSAWRRVGQGTYQREAALPDVRCLSYMHDVDYTAYKPYPQGISPEAASGAWCPPPGFAHAGQ